MKTRSRRQYRSARGSGLVEWVCGLALFLPIMIGLIGLAINVSLAFLYHAKLQAVADAAAKYFSGGHFWLGTVRPGVVDATATANTTTIVNNMLAALQLPAASNVTPVWNFNPATGTGISTVTVTVPGVRLPFGGLTLGGLTAIGISAEGSEGPFAQIVMGLPVNGNVNGTNAPVTHRIQALIPAIALTDQAEGIGDPTWTANGGTGYVPVQRGTTFTMGFEARGNCVFAGPHDATTNPSFGAVVTQETN